MKEERVWELAQYGWLLAMSLFIIFTVSGLILDCEDLMILAVLILLYWPALLIVVVIWAISDEMKKWSKRRKITKRKEEGRILQCPICREVYNREELDISATATPICPKCKQELVRM